MRLIRVANVVGSDFSLLDGDVNNLVRPGAIARRENMRCARLHLGVRDDAAVLRFHAGFFQIEQGRVWHAAQREENFLGRNGNGFSVVREGDGFQFSLPLRTRDFCVRKNLDALAAKNFFDLDS